MGRISSSTTSRSSTSHQGSNNCRRRSSDPHSKFVTLKNLASTSKSISSSSSISTATATATPAFEQHLFHNNKNNTNAAAAVAATTGKAFGEQHDNHKVWTGWELFASTVMALAVSTSFILIDGYADQRNHQDKPISKYWPSSSSSTSGADDGQENRYTGDSNSSNSGGDDDGGGGGGGPLNNAFLITAPFFEQSMMEQQQQQQKEDNANYDISVRAVQGDRVTMEDEYFVAPEGRFVAVYDGHGGNGVSTYLRDNLFLRLKQQLQRRQWMDQETPSQDYRPSISSYVTALRTAFDRIDEEVMARDEMQYQGSTAVAVAIHEAIDGSRTLLSANVGDSRAILCRDGKAVDLTRDHKPSDEREKARILALGETIEWDHFCKVHRVKNLSLSRAIGDRFAKPAVSGQVEIKHFPLRESTDEFVVLASDGLWDVMTSDQVVNFVKRKMDALSLSGSLGRDNIERLMHVRKKNMSRYLAGEALKLGSEDNVCVVVMWLGRGETANRE